MAILYAYGIDSIRPIIPLCVWCLREETITQNRQIRKDQNLMSPNRNFNRNFSASYLALHIHVTEWPKTGNSAFRFC